MILLFFAVLCIVAWWYVSNLKDKGSEAVIPGLKILLVVMAAILILVDAFMFFETDRLVMAASTNSSCVSYIGSSIIYPETMSLVNGSAISGTIDSLDYKDDGSVYTVIEDSGTPPALLYINYTGVTAFTTFHFNGYDDRNGSLYTISLQRASDGAWVDIYAFNGATGMIANNIDLNGTPYINNTNVTLRLTSSDTGNVSNRLYLDWMVVDGATTYTAYCADGIDTQYIFIYHQMETDMMVVLLSILPYLGLGVFAFLAIQVVMLIFHFGQKKPGEKE